MLWVVGCGLWVVGCGLRVVGWSGERGGGGGGGEAEGGKSVYNHAFRQPHVDAARAA